MKAASVHEFHYLVRQHVAGNVPGAHRSRRGDAGQEFRGHRPLADAGDVRRIDIHASLRDPLGQWQVRLFSERKSMPVVVVADLSASMAYVGERRKLDVLADFTEAAAQSAWRAGDPFGFVGCEDTLQNDWLLPPTRRRGMGVAIAARLRGFRPSGSAGSLGDAARVLPLRRSLVFLVSDFHLPLATLDTLLSRLVHHELVPVMLWDRQEFEWPGNGLVRLSDPEDGSERLVWMRAALRERWACARAERLEALQALFHRHRLSPLGLGGYEADAVSAHFVRA